MFRKFQVAPFHVHDIHRRSNADICMAIHTATHIDAPYHFFPDGVTIDRVPLDRLVGEYPQEESRYRERSPIFHLDGFDRPVILLQGLEDKIVPPNQAELILESLKKRGVSVAYVPFEGEQHGFRKAENIVRAYEAELYFYSRIFGFPLADPVEPVPIENL